MTQRRTRREIPPCEGLGSDDEETNPWQISPPPDIAITGDAHPYTQLNPNSRGGGNYAPHKPLLLICILELAEAGELDPPRLEKTPGLRLRFDAYWAIVQPRWRGLPGLDHSPFTTSARRAFGGPLRRTAITGCSTRGLWTLDESHRVLVAEEIFTEWGPETEWLRQRDRRPAVFMEGTQLRPAQAAPALAPSACLRALSVNGTRRLARKTSGEFPQFPQPMSHPSK